MTKLIRLELGSDSIFWFWRDIRLSPWERQSPIFNLEGISDTDIEVLDKSIRRLLVAAYDQYGNRLTKITDTIETNAEIDDNEEDGEDYAIEVVSATCAEEEPEEEIKATEEDFKEAEIILSKNGNTARRTIEKLLVDLSNKGLVLALAELEKNNAQRVSVLKAINTLLALL